MNKNTLIVWIILICYICMAGYQLHLPGLHYDEAQESGLPALQIVSGKEVSLFRNIGFGNNRLPIMVQDYIGALHVYITVPFVAILGPSTVSIRIPSILIGATILLLTFSFIRTVWGERIALLATVLLAMHPSFVFWSRQGTLIASITLALMMALFWACRNWYIRGTWQTAIVVGLLAGLGTYSKILFVWILLGIISTTIIINLPNLMFGHKKMWPRQPNYIDMIAAIAGFAIGISPVVVFNLMSKGASFARTGDIATSNSNILENVLGRIDHFVAVLTGNSHLWYLGSSPGNRLWLWALVISLIVSITSTVWHQTRSQKNFVLLLLLLTSLLQVPFTPTPSGLFPHHLAIFAPLWTTLVAVSITSIPRLLLQIYPLSKNYHFTMLIVIAWAFTTLITKDLHTNIKMHATLGKVGGESPHTDAIYTLANHLDRMRPQNTVALDWGFAPQVQFLTNERIKPQEVFGFTEKTDAGFVERLDHFNPDNDTVYVLHTEAKSFINRRTDFALYTSSRGRHLENIGTISQSSGTPIFEIFVANKEK
ncbi:MAG: hypothetical protein CL612_06865 [Anaerolineaceae bacterium]|nr:hypothetical protein [Anaerolineaceae bacterium]